MSGFAKAYKSMLQSSIWLESHETVRVWFTLLMLSDANGFVATSVKGLSHTSRVTLEDTMKALSIFQSPDPDSKSPENEGRRIEAVEGGFLLLNHGKYRRGDPHSAGAKRQRKYRDSEQNVTSCHVDSEYDSVTNKQNKQKRKTWRFCPSDFEPTETHVALAAENGLDLAAELAEFRDHEFATPKTDPGKTFANWLRRAAKYNRRGPSAPRSGGFKARAVADMFDRAKALREAERGRE